jgi:MEMO1 family protein
MRDATGRLRRSAVAGSWYPGTAASISSEVDGYLRDARAPRAEGRLVGLISPHAGLRYSGPVAAHGYALLAGRSNLTAVLVGPSHRYRFDGVALWARGAFETPLGIAPIDEGLADAILGADRRAADEPRPHREEHSLEMQLPFLQHLVDGLRIVPCLMGTQSRDEVDRLAGALVEAVGDRRDVLLVASSDLSHYHPALVANRLDGVVVKDIEAFDADGLMLRLEASLEHACGGGPMVCVMKAARRLGADASAVLRYGDSGDVAEEDKSRVVGYVSAALFQRA